MKTCASLLQKAFSILSGERCVVCNKTPSLLHPDCSEGLFPSQKYSPLSLFSYKDKRVKILMRKLKSRPRYMLSSTLGYLLAGKIKEEMSGETVVVCPIPPRKERLRRYGFNQAQLLSKYTAKNISNSIHFPHLLIRAKNTSKQSLSASRTERINKMKNAFSINKRYVGMNIETIIVVDDVSTTGATLSSAEKTIRTSFPDARIVLCCVAT